MNPHRMRELFHDALTAPAPTPPSSTDDIVAAGRRSHRRRRAAQAGSGTLAAAAALALAAFPAVFGQGGAAPPAEGEETTSCQTPPAAPTEEHAAAAAVYTEVLVDRLSDIGGTLDHSCAAGEVDYDGFHYEPHPGGYRFDETAVFSETGERARLTVDVLDPMLGPPMERMEDLAGCSSIEETCDWKDGVLLIEEEHRTGEGETGEPLPGFGALTGLGDGTIVHVRMDALGGPGALSTTPEQLGELARALVDEIESSAMEEEIDASAPWSEEELIEDFTEAVSAVLPEAALESEPPIVFVDPGEDQDYGEDRTAVAIASAVVDGQEVELFLQKTPVDSPGDGVGREVAEHYARCDHAAACEFLEVDDSTSRVHRTATRGGTELTSLEFRAGDGWVLGVGVVFSGETPPVDFATLDALVARIG